MKSKMIMQIASLVMFFALALPVTTSASEPVVKTENPRVEQISHRLNEIKALDKSQLTRTEKKVLRTE